MGTHKKTGVDIEEANTMSSEELASIKEDAEKWRDWTKGEYRLICKKKYAQFVQAYKTLHPKKARVHIITIPDKCLECNGETFNVWGTKYPYGTQIEVRCMRCGKPTQ